MTDGRDIEEIQQWLLALPHAVPQFLQKLKVPGRPGRYHYSLTGDYLREKAQWGLGNSVFFLKIIYTLGLRKEYEQEVEEACNFIQSFQKPTGFFIDQWIEWSSVPYRLWYIFKTGNIHRGKQVHLAETRQAFSAMTLFSHMPRYAITSLVESEQDIERYLSALDWHKPWAAGSHFSHLLFFFACSLYENKETLIDAAIRWVNRLQHSDGFWYMGTPSLSQKINGAMKILTGLLVAERMNFAHADRILDTVLSAQHDTHACDHFNITFVLTYCTKVVGTEYRNEELNTFAWDRLRRYRAHYYPSIGGFSFLPGSSGKWYYDAPVSRGRNEPDIHGTCLFLWGVSLLVQILDREDIYPFHEFIS